MWVPYIVYFIKSKKNEDVIFLLKFSVVHLKSIFVYELRFFLQ